LAGRLLSARKPVVAGDPSSGIFQQQWDSAGRFFKEIYPDSKAVTFELDANGNVTKIVYPDGYFVERAYDQLNRLSAIKLNGATTNAVSFSYDPLSRRTNMAFSSGGSVAYDWQLNDDLTGLNNNFVGSSLALTYGFNSVHQITSQNFSDDQYSWHPGAAGSVAYDPAGSTNQYPQVGGNPFVYDGNGCLTSDGVWTHGYDTENHLLSSSMPGTDLAFVYDPFHRQAEKAATTTGTSKTRFIYSGWQRIADYDSVSGALQNRYVYGTGLDEPLIQVSAAGGLTFLHANHQGSVLAVTDNAGAVINRNAYGPFGEGSPTGTTFGYTGQRYDSESGLQYFKRRYYDPASGRFLQPDPIGYQIEAACGCTCSGGCGGDAEPSQLNLYAYVENDPLNSQDPFGLDGVVTTLVRTGVTSRGTGPYPVNPWSGELNPYLGPDPRAIPGRYNIPPTLQPEIWEPVIDFQPGPGYQECIRDIYKRIKDKCFKNDAEKQKWIKDEVERCKKKFTGPTGEFQERNGGEAAWFAKYNPQTKQWEYYKKA